MAKVRRTAGATQLEKKLTPAAPPAITHQELARKLGVTSQAVSNWLAGRAKPARETAFKIEKMLGVPAESWFQAA